MSRLNLDQNSSINLVIKLIKFNLINSRKIYIKFLRIKSYSSIKSVLQFNYELNREKAFRLLTLILLLVYYSLEFIYRKQSLFLFLL